MKNFLIVFTLVFFGLKAAAQPVASDSLYTNLDFGVYIFQDGSFKAFQTSVFNTTGTNSFLHRNVSGFINEKTKATLAGNTSANIVHAADTLIFILDRASSAPGTIDLNTPTDFVLVQLEKKKSSREITVGKENALGSTDGIDEKYRIPFNVIPIFNGVFKVAFTSKPSPGEYAFFPAAKITRAIFPKVYDFTIQ